MAGAYYSMFEAAIKNAILVTQPIVTGLAGEAGATITVPMRAEANELKAKYPGITVGVRPGRIAPFGKSYTVKFDNASGLYMCAAVAQASRLVFTIETLRDAQRHYILDALLAGIMADYTVESNGTVLEQSIAQQLVAIGILFSGSLDAATYVESEAAAPRQEGQVFKAILPLVCDIYLQWTRPAVVNPGATINPVVTLLDEPAAQSPIYWPSTDNPEPSAPITW